MTDAIQPVRDALLRVSFPAKIADIARSVGESPRSRKFLATMLWPAIEAYRAATGRQLRQKKGELVLLSQEDALKDARKKRDQGARKTGRALDIATKVDAGEDKILARRRERFLDRLDSARAKERAAVVDMEKIEAELKILDTRREELAAKRRSRSDHKT